LRYRTNERDNGLAGKEGTYVICSFWLVSALAVVRSVDGIIFGEFPQAFSHLALIEVTARVINPDAEF